MYQFAAAVTQFGLLLRESRFVKDGSWNDVLDLAIPSADVTIPSQMEFIGMVQQAKNIYGKKRKKKE
jgi:Ca-activated chloride channel family protein